MFVQEGSKLLYEIVFVATKTVQKRENCLMYFDASISTSDVVENKRKTTKYILNNYNK